MTAAACPGLAAHLEGGWPMPNRAEPMVITLAWALRCPACGSLVTRLELAGGALMHAPPAPAEVTKGGPPEEVRITAADPGAGMTAGELADAVDGLPRETKVKGEAGFRGQIRAVKFVR